AQDYFEEELDGIVSGMQNFGLFVEIPGLGFEGLARFKTIPGDFYEYNEDKHIVYGRRSGRVIQNGDTIRIKVIKVNVLRGEIDFAGVTGGASNDSESQRNSSPEGRRENFRRKHSEKTPARKKGERSHHRRGEKSAKKATQEKLFDEDGSGQGSKISISLRGLEPGEFSEDGSGGEAISPWDMIQRTQNKSSIQDDQIIQVQDPNRKEKEAWSNVRGMSEPRQVKKKGFRKLKDNPDKYEASWDEPNKKSKKSSKSKKSTKSANATLKSLENELDIFDEILTDDRSWQGKSVKRKSSGTSRSSKAKSAQPRNGSQKAGDAQSTWRKKSETTQSKKSSSNKSKNFTRQKKPHKGSSHESE
ncbi:MAG: S1 RNA-binding domain-containing protein, partial [Planctomycetota bacterium]|nr:S1 RNA-binding domain-containing protein [Planctomycetota bacterium]